ncbi:hypothetical protein ACH44C_33530 [Streptomyces purpureus]|uniref:hypothetical protein n=1 Tax=Streptomyces purpureus TaxID=1951 RepID=UPI003794DE20
MPERIHPTQPNTVPHQADAPPTPSADARDVLRQIADRITQVRPHHPMTEPARHGLALRYASAEYGTGTGCEALEHEVLTHLPHVDQPITRGEYALLLREAAQA